MFCKKIACSEFVRFKSNPPVAAKYHQTPQDRSAKKAEVCLRGVYLCGYTVKTRRDCGHQTNLLRASVFSQRQQPLLGSVSTQFRFETRRSSVESDHARCVRSDVAAAPAKHFTSWFTSFQNILVKMLDILCLFWRHILVTCASVYLSIWERKRERRVGAQGPSPR